jgi:hypothetical protein
MVYAIICLWIVIVFQVDLYAMPGKELIIKETFLDLSFKMFNFFH